MVLDEPRPLPVGVGTEGPDEPPGGTDETDGLRVPPGEDSGELPLGLDPAGVVVAAGVVSVSVSVTGQTVVETATVEVTTTVDSAGQFVMLAAQLVTVNFFVL